MLFSVQLLGGCGNDSDTEQDYCLREPVYGAAYGGKWFVNGEISIIGFTANRGQAYWIAEEQTPGQRVYSTVLHQCEIANCEKTVQSNAWNPGQEAYGGDRYSPTEASVPLNIALAASAKRLFWAESHFDLMGIGYCEKDNCSDTHHLRLGDAAVSTFGVDGNQLVVLTLEDTLLICNEDDCDASLKRVPMVAPEGEADYVSGSHITFDDQYIYVVSEERVLRVRKDGSRPFEVLARDVGPVGQLVVHSDSVYWTERFPAGLRSCLKTGCQEQPNTVISALHDPVGLVVDDDFFYISEPAEQLTVPASDNVEYAPGSDRILRCDTASCVAIGTHDHVLGPMVEDGKNLVTLVTSPNRPTYLPPTAHPCEPTFGIGTVAKNAEGNR